MLIQDFASSINNETQTVLQVVEHQRYAIPNFFEDTLTNNIGKPIQLHRTKITCMIVEHSIAHSIALQSVLARNLCWGFGY